MSTSAGLILSAQGTVEHLGPLGKIQVVGGFYINKFAWSNYSLPLMGRNRMQISILYKKDK